MLEKIKDALSVVVDPTSGEEIAKELAYRLSLLAYSDQMLHDAKLAHDSKKGEIFKMMRSDPELMKFKEVAHRLYIAGELREEEANFQQVERVIKSLDASIEGLRSLLSYAKDQQRNHPNNP